MEAKNSCSRGRKRTHWLVFPIYSLLLPAPDQSANCTTPPFPFAPRSKQPKDKQRKTNPATEGWGAASQTRNPTAGKRGSRAPSEVKVISLRLAYTGTEESQTACCFNLCGVWWHQGSLELGREFSFQRYPGVRTRGVQRTASPPAQRSLTPHPPSFLAGASLILRWHPMARLVPSIWKQLYHQL